MEMRLYKFFEAFDEPQHLNVVSFSAPSSEFIQLNILQRNITTAKSSNLLVTRGKSQTKRSNTERLPK